MKIIRLWKQVLVVCLALSFLVGCGQKGDLYLPEGSALISWMG